MEKKTSNEVMKFQNGQLGVEVRVMMNADGQPMFVGKDVAKALGYSNKSKAVQMHVEAEDKTTLPIWESGSNYKTRAVFINESGLYALILSSKLESARKFKHWVTSEVLPQIRQTGGYIPTHDAEGRRLSDEEIMLLSNQIMRRTLSQKNLPADDCLSATDVAKSLGLGDAQMLNGMLVDRGIIRWRAGRYHLAEKFEDRGLTGVRFFDYYTRKGEHKEKPYLVWTTLGVEFVKGVLMN